MNFFKSLTPTKPKSYQPKTKLSSYKNVKQMVQTHRAISKIGTFKHTRKQINKFHVKIILNNYLTNSKVKPNFYNTTIGESMNDSMRKKYTSSQTNAMTTPKSKDQIDFGTIKEKCSKKNLFLKGIEEKTPKGSQSKSKKKVKSVFSGDFEAKRKIPPSKILKKILKENFNEKITLKRSKSSRCLDSNLKLNLKKKQCRKMLTKNQVIDHRFKVLSFLGRGTFSEVYSCLNLDTYENVCLKIIKSKSQEQEQIAREIKNLKQIKNQDFKKQSNVCELKENFSYNNNQCLVFDNCGKNLLQMYTHNEIPMKAIKKIAKDILFSLLFINKEGIIHCDIKPENIVYDKGSSVYKLIDFGSSCSENNIIYSYIQSRYYRAPEVILGLKYTNVIDIWSLACVLCELYKRKPLFDGEDERDVLYHIMEYLGLPSKDFIEKSPKLSLFFDSNFEPFDEPNSKGIFRTYDSKDFFFFLGEDADKLFVDFIKKSLTWKPEERLTPEEALRHKWITGGMTEEEKKNHFMKINSILSCTKHKSCL